MDAIISGMESVISVKNLSKTYEGGFQALKGVDLDIKKGEIFALLGPNGAGKTTLISIICGITNATEGQVLVAGKDIVEDYRETRSMIGLVPQELTTDAFETVWATVNFSRGLFGKKADHRLVEEILKKLSLWDKKDNRLMTLSGGMKRRLIIAKALSHEPRILFLDEPTAGVDVELRKDMWNHVRALRESGVTIILTTHYIEEAEEIADRVGVINSGRLVMVEEKNKLMANLGTKKLIIRLSEPINQLPESLERFDVHLEERGTVLIYTYDPKKKRSRIEDLMHCLYELRLSFKDIDTKQSSLEEIFVNLVNES